VAVTEQLGECVFRLIPREPKFFRMFAARAGDSDNLRALTILETGNLRRLRKTRTDDSNVNSIFHENVCSYGLLI